jgi:hypothetical protein
MNIFDLIETKWQNFKDWYIELIIILSDLFKNIFLSLPKILLCIIVFFVFIYSAIEIGLWTVIIYLFLLFLGVLIFELHIKKKANNIDPSFFIGKTYSSKYGEIITTVMKVAEQNFDEKGNRIYLCNIEEKYMGGKLESKIKLVKAETLYRNIISKKEWTKIESDINPKDSENNFL